MFLSRGSSFLGGHCCLRFQFILKSSTEDSKSQESKLSDKGLLQVSGPLLHFSGSDKYLMKTTTSFELEEH